MFWNEHWSWTFSTYPPPKATYASPNAGWSFGVFEEAFSAFEEKFHLGYLDMVFETPTTKWFLQVMEEKAVTGC